MTGFDAAAAKYSNRSEYFAPFWVLHVRKGEADYYEMI